LTKDII